MFPPSKETLIVTANEPTHITTKIMEKRVLASLSTPVVTTNELMRQKSYTTNENNDFCFFKKTIIHGKYETDDKRSPKFP